MKNIRYYLAAVLLLGVLFCSWWVSRSAEAQPASTSSVESLRFMRPGYPYSHATISVTNASAATAQLAANAVYRLVCQDDIYYDMGGSTVAATTSEAYLPGDTVQYVRTTDAIRYLAAIRRTNDCTCFLAEEM